MENDSHQTARRPRLSATRYFLFTVGSILLIPIVLLGVALVGALPDTGPINRCATFFYIEVGYWLYKLGMPEFIANTGGHMPHLTIFGMAVVYLIPACLCFYGGRRMRIKASQTSAPPKAISRWHCWRFAATSLAFIVIGLPLAFRFSSRTNLGYIEFQLPGIIITFIIVCCCLACFFLSPRRPLAPKLTAIVLAVLPLLCIVQFLADYYLHSSYDK